MIKKKLERDKKEKEEEEKVTKNLDDILKEGNEIIESLEKLKNKNLGDEEFNCVPWIDNLYNLQTRLFQLKKELGKIKKTEMNNAIINNLEEKLDNKNDELEKDMDFCEDIIEKIVEKEIEETKREIEEFTKAEKEIKELKEELKKLKKKPS